MAAPPIPSALDARTQIFPTLTPSQIGRIRPQGHVRHVDRGEILFDVGDTNIPFFVILSGSMEVVQPGLETANAPSPSIVPAASPANSP
jgi:thioredoxin reductase (NADPH)